MSLTTQQVNHTTAHHLIKGFNMTKETGHEVKVKRVRRGFTMVSNAFLEDAEISLKAKGFVYFLSKPEGWKLNIKGDVVKRSKDGYGATYAGIKELIDAGYVSRTKKQSGEVTYHLFEDKSDNDIPDYAESADHENPDQGNPDHENPDQRNRDVLVIPKDSNTEYSNTDSSKEGETPPTKTKKSQPTPVEQNSKKFIVNRLLDLDIDDELVAEYWHYRETIKKNRLTNRAVSELVNECERHNFNLSEAIKTLIANGWTGFKVQWVHNQNQSFGNNERPQMSKREAVEAHNAKIAEELKAQLRGIDYEH